MIEFSIIPNVLAFAIIDSCDEALNLEINLSQLRLS